MADRSGGLSRRLRSLVALTPLVLAAVASGCASGQGAGAPPAEGERGGPTVTVRTEPLPAPPATPPPGPVVPVPPAAPPPSPPPSVSIGPKPEPPAAPAPPAPAAPSRAAAPADPGTAPAAPAAPAPPRRFVMFNFDNADLEVVVQAASEIAGFNYVIAPAARGRKITVQTTTRVASDEVFGVLLTILDANGLAAVRTGNLYRIIPREGAPQSPLRTVIGRELDPLIPDDQMVTVVAPLAYISAADAATLLRPFAAPGGSLTAHRETNLLIVTDTAANARRMLEIVARTDVPVALDELRIIQVRHADVQELAQLLTQIFAAGRLRTGTTPGAPPVPIAPAAPGAPPRTPGDLGGPDRAPLIVAERRSNSLVINAAKQDMAAIVRLVEQLDVDVYGGQRVFMYFLENTKAKELAATLDQIFNRTPVTPPGTTPGRTTGVPPVQYGVSPGGPGVPTPPVVAVSPGPGRPAIPVRPGGLEDASPGSLSDIRFVPDEVTNAIIVTTYPRNWKEIEETIKKLDRMPRQVLIEVLAAEVTLTDEMRLGIEWAIRSGRFDASFGARPGASSGTSVIGPRPDRLLVAPPVFGGSILTGLNFFTFATEKFISALNALASDNKVNVLSSPSIMTLENKKAVINVSTSVPVVTGQQVPVATGGTTGNSITQQVEYRDAGIILTVTPRIGEGGTVALDVKQEVNEVGENEPPPINSPRFTKREAETSVVLLNNQTLVLGGLIQTKRTLTRTGIPFLNKIPVLGYLFGTRGEKIEKTELMLLITPRVIGTAADAARITEQMQRITPAIEESIRQSPRPPSPR